MDWFRFDLCKYKKLKNVKLGQVRLIEYIKDRCEKIFLKNNVFPSNYKARTRTLTQDTTQIWTRKPH